MSKALPKNVEAEKSVIAAALVDEDNAKNILIRLEEDDFTVPTYKYIFHGLQLLNDNEMSLDIKNIAAILKETNHLDDVGGPDGLSDLMNEYISNEGLEDLCNLLIDKKTVRLTLLKMRELEADYFASKFKDDLDFLGRAETDIRKIAGNRRTDGYRALKETAVEVRGEIEEARIRGNDLIGVDTGYAGINRYTLGLSKGELVVIAARPSVGKTALAVNIGINVTRITNSPVLMFSLEMSDTDLGKRILSNIAGIDGKKIQTGKIKGEDLMNVESAISVMKKIPFYIDASASLKINDLVSKARKFKVEHPDLQMIVIDYLGLIQPDRRYENLRIQIGNICHMLKALAKELEVPVVILSQLRRAMENGADKRPEMNDLRESGDIEQDADKILLLYRSDYYQKNMRALEARDAHKGETGNGVSEPEAVEEPIKYENGQITNAYNPKVKDPSMVECIIAKNRNGEVGTVYLWFIKALSKFSDPTIESIQEYKHVNKIND